MLINLVKKYRRIILMLIDIVIVGIAYIVTRFLLSGSLDGFLYRGTIAFWNSIFISVLVYQIFLNLFEVYKNMPSYESGKDYLVYIFVCMISCCVVCMLGNIFNLRILSVRENMLSGLLVAVIMVGYRLVIRIFLTNTIEIKKTLSEANRKNLLIIGAGLAGKDIVKVIKMKMNNAYNIVGIIDDDENKKNCAISGVRIVGSRKDIIQACEDFKVDVIFFSITKIDNKDKRDILNICQNTGAKIRILPSTEDIIRNKSLVENLRDVEIEDILGRDPIVLDNKNITDLIKNKVVLVTGGGGSIGSELCRQIIKNEPSKLLILDIYENSLYDIELELKRRYPNQAIEAIVASVRDRKRLEEIFKIYQPNLVFHAAAHKHVPLMEYSPCEAVKNNVFGTYHLIECADLFQVEKFVLISTDKAVNPTSIMGATKRICEMMIQAKERKSNTEFVAVRFGNVLGSNGSVVPLFKKQIAEGGPVTVTHKEITRFFMTIQEAVGLILQATTYARGGEIFVLDMGEPVKIYDLAVSLIKLSGLEPDVDIAIKVTGLRPGEKLYEELLMSEEGLQKTAHNKIFVAEPMDITVEEVKQKLSILQQVVTKPDTQNQEVKQAIKEVVPTFIEKEKANHYEN